MRAEGSSDSEMNLALSVYAARMATKTIDRHGSLPAAHLGDAFPKESFSQVMRRARWDRAGENLRRSPCGRASHARDGWSGVTPPGVTDPAERQKLRAETDALVAQIYGLTESEFAHILSTFPLVDESIQVQTRNTCRKLVNPGKFA